MVTKGQSGYMRRGLFLLGLIIGISLFASVSLAQVTSINYTDDSFEGIDNIQIDGEIFAVDFNLGGIANITGDVEVCLFAEQGAGAVINMTSNITSLFTLSLPVGNSPSAYTCINVSTGNFSDGLNRIGLQCQPCGGGNRLWMGEDTTVPINMTSYYWDLSTWNQRATEDFGIKVIFNTSEGLVPVDPPDPDSLTAILNWETPRRLDSGITFEFTNIALEVLNAQYNNNSWFVGFTIKDIAAGGGGSRELYMTKHNNDNPLTLLINTTIPTVFPSAPTYDFQIIDNEDILTRYIFLNQTTAVRCWLEQVNISQVDLSLGEFEQLVNIQPNNCNDASDDLSLTKDWSFIFPAANMRSVRQQTANTYRVFDGTSEADLFIPIGETIVNNPFFFYNPVWNTYNLFYDDMDRIKVLYYDSSLGFLGLQTLVDLNNNINQTSVLRIDNGILVSGVMNNTAVFLGSFHWNLPTHYAAVDEGAIIISNANESYPVHSPVLALDQDKEQRYLFYSLTNSTRNVVEGIYFLAEDIPCTCDVFFNTSACIGDNRIRERSCTPSGCDDETEYVFDAVCNETQSLEDRHQIQRTERFCEIQTCDSNFVNPSEQGSVSCRASIPINQFCTSNIESNASLTTRVIRTSGFIFGSLGENKYHILLCNPLDDCFETDPLCESQWNFTDTKDWLAYYPNDTIAAHFEMSNAQQCKSVREWMYDYGWKEYAVSGSLQYCCDRQCGGDTCVRRGVVDYKIQQFPDCTLNESSRILCTNGCSNGACLERIGEREIRSPSGDPMEWIISEATNTFPTVILMLFSVGISGAVGVSVAKQTKDWRMGMMMMMGMILVFLSVGWLPMIVGVLWIISAALMLAYLISGRAGSGGD